LREELPVHFDASLFEATDESAVGHSVGSARRVDADDPKATEVTLASSTVSILVLTGLLHGTNGSAEEVLTATKVALAGFEQLRQSLTTNDGTLNARHGNSFAWRSLLATDSAGALPQERRG
jgi:hypothetical protein